MRKQDIEVGRAYVVTPGGQGRYTWNVERQAIVRECNVERTQYGKTKTDGVLVELCEPFSGPLSTGGWESVDREAGDTILVTSRLVIEPWTEEHDTRRLQRADGAARVARLRKRLAELGVASHVGSHTTEIYNEEFEAFLDRVDVRRAS